MNFFCMREKAFFFFSNGDGRSGSNSVSNFTLSQNSIEVSTSGRFPLARRRQQEHFGSWKQMWRQRWESYQPSCPGHRVVTGMALGTEQGRGEELSSPKEGALGKAAWEAATSQDPVSLPIRPSFLSPQASHLSHTEVWVCYQKRESIPWMADTVGVSGPDTEQKGCVILCSPRPAHRALQDPCTWLHLSSRWTHTSQGSYGKGLPYRRKHFCAFLKVLKWSNKSLRDT
jgi:hypothetical protein